MRTIYKYALDAKGEQIIDMPGDALILSAQVQNGTICLWALVNPGAAPTQHKIAVFGTGHPFDLTDSWRFIGTVQMHGGALVFHVFEDLGSR